MYYKNGYPIFSIEKPKKYPYIPRLREMMADRQKSGGWYGELKLNEHRGFICLDENGKAIFYTYRHRTPVQIRGDALNRIEAMGIPPSTVLDGGHLFRKEMGPTRLWIFDVLVLAGEKVKVSCDQRKDLLDNLIKTDELIWRPLRTDFWLKEFEDMMIDNSSLIKKAALQYGLPYDDLKLLIEGLVVKRKGSVLTFPSSKKEVGSYLKIRLADLPKSLRPEYIRPL